MNVIVTPTGSSPITIPFTDGYHKITDDIGVMVSSEAAGIRFITRRGGEYRIQWGNWDHTGYLPPRAILTIRSDSPAPTLGLLRPHGDKSDYGGVSGLEIEACGSGTLHDHDSIMQRCPVGIYDMNTGRLRLRPTPLKDPYYRLDRGPNKTTTLPQFVAHASDSLYDDNRIPLDATPILDPAMRAAVLAWWAYNGQHLIRAIRAAIPHLFDPFVAMDLAALEFDASLAWDTQRRDSIDENSHNNGSIECGREFGWVGYLTALVRSIDMKIRLAAIVACTQVKRTGIIQANRYGEFTSGSPDPWGDPQHGGSGVDKSIIVSQDLECYSQVIAFFHLGLTRQAELLAHTVLTKPLMKWVGTFDGLGHGIHGPAIDQAWPALGAWAKFGNREAALEAMKHWPIPTQQGGSVGPFQDLHQVEAALLAWNTPGKSRWAMEAIQ